MRYTLGDRSYECAVGDALVIDSGELACRPQLPRGAAADGGLGQDVR